MSEIADAAGISKPLLFHYFHNKLGLYLFLWEEAAQTTTDFLNRYGCYEKTDLFEIASRMVQELTPQAEKAGVTLSLTGEQSPMTGVPRLLSGIVYNLVENAIKYNKPEGSVTVSVVPATKSYWVYVPSVRNNRKNAVPPESTKRNFASLPFHSSGIGLRKTT